MFKVGDKVICVNNEGVESRLELNKIYTIIEVVGEMNRVLDEYGTKYGFYGYRFKLVNGKKSNKDNY